MNNACTPPESHGIAESFVKTFKRDYVCINDLPDAVSVMKTVVIKEFPVKRLEMLRLTALTKLYKSRRDDNLLTPLVPSQKSQRNQTIAVDFLGLRYVNQNKLNQITPSPIAGNTASNEKFTNPSAGESYKNRDVFVTVFMLQ